MSRVDSEYDLVVIGGGAAGLAAARTAVRRNARVLLVADGPVGGDCTFTGCVPSKTLIEAAARGTPFGEALGAVRTAVATLAAAEDDAALGREGIAVLHDRAEFVSPRQVIAGGRALSARGFVIATGAGPTVPPVPGLAESGYLTNETVFDLADRPASMAVLGGGAIGCELAQAFHRVGVQVTVIEVADRLLPGEDGDASEVIERVFAAEGIAVRTGARVHEAGRGGGGVRLSLDDGTGVHAERLLMAAGRSPDIEGLGLEAAGVRVDDRGHVVTDRHLATSSPRVYAAGDVTGRAPFTHAAYAMGRVAAANALGPRRRAVYGEADTPRVVFTDPEVAQVGIVEAGAPSGARVARLAMDDFDRAIMAGRTQGFVKLIAGPRPLLGHTGGGRLLGATIVAPHAGELIHEAVLALRTSMFAGRLAQAVHAYPTWSLAVQQTAAQLVGHGPRPHRIP